MVDKYSFAKLQSQPISKCLKLTSAVIMFSKGKVCLTKLTKDKKKYLYTYIFRKSLEFFRQVYVGIWRVIRITKQRKTYSLPGGHVYMTWLLCRLSGLAGVAFGSAPVEAALCQGLRCCSKSRPLQNVGSAHRKSLLQHSVRNITSLVFTFLTLR